MFGASASIVAPLLAVGFVSSVAGAATPPIDSCLTRSAPAERSRCIREAWSGSSLGPSELTVLEGLVRDDPAAVAALIGPGGMSVADAAGRALQARFLDLQGEALRRTSREAEAAERYVESVRLDDGTPKLRWIDETGSISWSASLDAGSGRLTRVGGALLDAGRGEEARELLARALRLGAGEDAQASWGRTGGGPVPGLDPQPTALLAPRWFRRVPDLEVPLLDGGVFPLAGARGKVLLLDFWASWCRPCLTELPRLQELYDAERDRGFAAIAINARETEHTARHTADALGLTLPLGRYDGALDSAFRVEALPTVIVADREGRIRSRWNGYVPGLESAIASSVRDLLGDDPGGAPERVGEAMLGANRLRGRWTRTLPVPVRGLTAARAADGAVRIAALGRATLLLLGPEGDGLSSHPAPPEAGSLQSGDLNGDGEAELIGFRSGAKGVVVFDSRTGEARGWSAPSEVMDAAVLPASGEFPAALVLATLSGLALAGPQGEPIEPVRGTGRATAVAIAGEGASRRAACLASDGTLRWVSLETREVEREMAVAEGWKLIRSARGEIGVAPVETVAAASGDFTGEGERQVALATASGQLIVLETAGGTERFRAAWPGIAALASEDLDGDGRTELIVAAGRSLTVLEGGSP